MTTRIVREIEVDGETVQYAINTRGADRPWSAADDEAMQAIVRAAVRRNRASLRCECGEPNGTHTRACIAASGGE